MNGVGIDYPDIIRALGDSEKTVKGLAMALTGDTTSEACEAVHYLLAGLENEGLVESFKVQGPGAGTFYRELMSAMVLPKLRVAKAALVGEGSYCYGGMRTETVTGKTMFEALKIAAARTGGEVRVTEGKVFVDWGPGSPFGLDTAALSEPFCACGHVISRCDGSRKGCGK